ncbi:Peptidase M60, enhancin and enhancin-like [Arenibacter nanhaiticus]|uniref:Peptidase M60, enhancin and enhancin-like n=1 Tax=Arenibacter nanhaiticus TaxID=558155 RepID=A0A1M6LLJ2_9FLAO|nr:M60 family metallopeptidase [Arenibacter nanhaiticus]SHJ72033.1 Peptidase M60, enhancin and enhancin-like [Arenibacter nanhaiticus]
MKKNFITILFCSLFIVAVHGQSASEIAAVYTDLSVFETPMALSLKKKVKKRDIANIKNERLRETAEALYAQKYDANFRMARYGAYLSPTVLGQELMIGDGYSKYENITGIYMPTGKQLVLVDGIAANTEVGLVIVNWNRRAPEGIDPTKDPAGWGIQKKEFRLQNGVNIVEVTDFDGLAYIDYFSDDPETKNAIQVHFPSAPVNGYFDSATDTDADWNNLVDNAVYPIVDARGKHIQIAYPAADIKKYAYNRGMELINNYDSLVYRQHRILGLTKYNKVPKNHILARVNYNYYMFRDGDGVAYMGTEPGNAMAMVVDPSRVISGDPCWGFSHEVGHVHQLRPYFNWGGLGEVSNNIFSLYVTTSYGNKSRIANQENYKKSRESIIDGKISYLQDGDVFNRVVPFWQLQLYFAGIGNNPDFYPDLFEAFRQQGEAKREKNGNPKRAGGWGDRGNNPAKHQLNFVKTACEVSKTDLTDFFDLYGFFHIGEFDYNDYGNYTYKMTQEMVDACKAEIKAMNLPKPKIDISTLED